MTKPLLMLLTAAMALVGCPDEPPPNPRHGYPPTGYPPTGYPPTGYPPTGYPPTGYPPTAYPPPTATAPPPAPTAAPLPPVDPNAPPGTATAIDPNTMAAAAPTLNGLAAQHMPRMQPEGGPFAGSFREGDKLTQVVHLVPGRCYGVIGVGAGIADLDLELVLGEAPVDYTMGSDGTKGPQAIIGPGGKCIQNTLPTEEPAKVIVTAKAGRGSALVQIYWK
jgi:hypothetical protein